MNRNLMPINLRVLLQMNVTQNNGQTAKPTTSAEISTLTAFWPRKLYPALRADAEHPYGPGFICFHTLPQC